MPGVVRIPQRRAPYKSTQVWVDQYQRIRVFNDLYETSEQFWDRFDQLAWNSCKPGACESSKL